MALVVPWQIHTEPGSLLAFTSLHACDSPGPSDDSLPDAADDDELTGGRSDDGRSPPPAEEDDDEVDEPAEDDETEEDAWEPELGSSLSALSPLELDPEIEEDPEEPLLPPREILLQPQS